MGEPFLAARRRLRISDGAGALGVAIIPLFKLPFRARLDSQLDCKTIRYIMLSCLSLSESPLLRFSFAAPQSSEEMHVGSSALVPRPPAAPSGAPSHSPSAHCFRASYRAALS